VIFYDTRNSTGRSGVDLYYAVSADGAQTFSAPVRLTGETSPNLGDPFEFGDYNGMDYATAERLLAVFTDNRQEGIGAGDSQDIYAVGQTAGGGPPPPPPPPGGGGGCAPEAIAIVLLIPILGAAVVRRRRL
jgi:hypothetical protein